MLSKLKDFLKAMGQGLADLQYVFFVLGKPDDLSADEEDVLAIAQDEHWDF